MFIDNGLLFANSANNASTLGCQIFDLLTDPFNPPIIGAWGGSTHDCHDSFARTNVSWASGKDLLFSADGYATRYRILDITNIRSGTPPTLLGETASVSGIYSHSNWLTDDSRYLYAFDEFNVRDIGVYDISNPASPAQVTTFQYSGDSTANARVHNGQIMGNYLFTAYYEAGFRVFDISNPANAVEVGKYETWRDPDGDGTFNQAVTGNYNGAWNLHVYLPSGNVLCIAAGGCASYRVCDGTVAFGSKSCSANQVALTQNQRVVIARGTSISTSEYVWIETTAGAYVAGTQVGTFNCANGKSRSRNDCQTAIFGACGTHNLGASSGTCP